MKRQIQGNKDKDKFRRTKKWMAFSKKLRKERPLCQCCGTKSKVLSVHHMDEKNYTDLSDESKFAVLCKPCHNMVSKLERTKKENWHKYDKLWVACFSRFLL